MAMSDAERIIEALAKARVKAALRQPWDEICEEDRSHFKSMAAKQLAELRALGGDVTMPPAPEPTYVYRMTGRELNLLINDIEFAAEQWTIENHKRDSRDRIARLRALTPDPEPGA